MIPETITPNEYQSLAMVYRSIRYADKESMKQHAIYGLCAEAGEAAGIMQKMFNGHPYDPEHMKKELGDVAWFLAEACTAFGFDLEDVMIGNLIKLHKRYPNGIFEVDRSINRYPEDI